MCLFGDPIDDGVVKGRIESAIDKELVEVVYQTERMPLALVVSDTDKAPDPPIVGADQGALAGMERTSQVSDLVRESEL